MSSVSGFSSTATSSPLSTDGATHSASPKMGQSPQFGSTESDSYTPKRVSKWDAAKAGMSSSWAWGVPYGLALAALSHFGLRDFDPAKSCEKCLKTHKDIEKHLGKPAILAMNIIPAVLVSLVAWTFYGAGVGAISAAVANHKQKKAESNNQGHPPQSQPGSETKQAFWTGAGISLGLSLTTSAMGAIGLFGKTAKKTTRASWTKPKLLLPALGIMVAGSALLGHISSKVSRWMQQQPEQTS